MDYDFDYDDYHSYVHGRLPYDILKPDPVLRNLLQSLPLRKVVGAANSTVGIDYALESIHNMKEAIPEIWEAVHNSDVHYPEKTPIAVIS
nr:suppressor of disruption of TFIIS-like [Ipomoea batatas]GME05462.1 suppressor of disruption of TFIIS-like [Ipomoea batatas]GME16038.1 suppressor of disruption of TFIIS-like [Ipomoea batatas]